MNVCFDASSLQIPPLTRRLLIGATMMAFHASALTADGGVGKVASRDNLGELVAVIGSRGSMSTTPRREAYKNVSSSRLECGIWLAPSTIPNAGLGVFAGKDFAYGEFLQQPLGEIVIPIVDLPLHNGYDDVPFLWDSYSWNSDVSYPNFPMRNEGFHEVSYASPGIGAATNGFLAMQNVHHSHPQWMELGLHRSRDPGAGAISHYGNRPWETLGDIGAGQELFLDYGDRWFEVRLETLGPVPLTNDLNRAMELVTTFRDIGSHVNKDPEQLHALWQQYLQNNTDFPGSDRVLASFNHGDPHEIGQLLSGKTLKDIRREQSTRNVDWLYEHGVCGDHIEVGPSTRPQAGMGAFASRNLPEGTLVSTLPMVHIPDRSVLNIYDLEHNEDGGPYLNPDLAKGHQLLTNYCFGHRQSTLLLCPYGPQAMYINHNQTQTNVKLVWSDPMRGIHQDRFVDLPLDQLTFDSTKISMDLVATRDILEGEEIFLDYGDEWEDAWNEHVRSWKPVPGADKYFDSVTLNEDWETPLLTPAELEEQHLSQYVEVKCNEVFKSDDWRDFFPDQMDDFLRVTIGDEYPCEVLEHRLEEDGNYYYTAVMTVGDAEIDDDEDIDEDEPSGRRVLLQDVPRDAITYYNRPYTTDMFLPNAFRHDIRIPDDMFPAAWKNLN